MVFINVNFVTCYKKMSIFCSYWLGHKGHNFFRPVLACIHEKIGIFRQQRCTYFWKLKSPLANKIMHGWQETLVDDFLTSSKKSLQITKFIQKLASKWLFMIPGGVEGISRNLFWSQSHLKFIIVIKSSIGFLWVP